MFNPPNFYSNPNSYDEVLRQLTQRLQAQAVDDQLLAILKQAVEKELDTSNILLSRPDRVRLLQQSAKNLLLAALAKIDPTP